MTLMTAISRALVRLALGARLPRIDGVQHVDGAGGEITIRRDAYGIPHVEAGSEDDAWFGAGFCHGQDRAFQLELLSRGARGTLCELFGRRALPLDRLARRAGFLRAAEERLAAIEPRTRAVFESYARGVNAGLQRVPHELRILRARTGGWTAADSLAVLALQSFAVATDCKLARLKILLEDGRDALRALDRAGADGELPPAAAGPIERLQRDSGMLRNVVPSPGFGGSNAWALAPSRTATARPILANDPHLSPAGPPHWYLLHIRTPEWSAAGASFTGTPGVPIGHNGHVAWGITIAFMDDTQLTLEPEAESFPVRPEVIAIRGAEPHVEEVRISPRGPIISPALDGLGEVAIALDASWLRPLPLRGLLDAHRARSGDELREICAQWPGLGLNVVWADDRGSIGHHVAARVLRRSRGGNTVPSPPEDSDADWSAPLTIDELPSSTNPPDGFIASANHRPESHPGQPFLGRDYLDDYRVRRVRESLAARRDWTVADSMRLQLDVESVVWRDLRAHVLALAGAGVSAAIALLRDWDGRLDADSHPALVFSLFLAEFIGRVTNKIAPKSAPWALGRGFTALGPYSVFGLRRVEAMVRLALSGAWDEDLRAALGEALLKADGRTWGDVHRLTMHHPFASMPVLGSIFRIGPVPRGGDANTLSQASVDLRRPEANPHVIASLRMTVDVGNWDDSRYVLPGGQSGNPFSPHYADQFPLWCRGGGIPIAWSDAAVRDATRATLTLRPPAHS